MLNPNSFTLDELVEDIDPGAHRREIMLHELSDQLNGKHTLLGIFVVIVCLRELLGVVPRDVRVELVRRATDTLITTLDDQDNPSPACKEHLQ